MYRAIYEDTDISVWQDLPKEGKPKYIVVNNNTREVVFAVQGEEFSSSVDLPVAVRAAFNLLDNEGIPLLTE